MLLSMWLCGHQSKCFVWTQDETFLNLKIKRSWHLLCMGILEEEGFCMREQCVTRK